MSNLLLVIPDNVRKLTAILYSVEQDCFHLETISDYVTNNIKRCMIKQKCNEYRLIGVCENDVDGDNLIEEFKKVQKKILKR